MKSIPLYMTVVLMAGLLDGGGKASPEAAVIQAAYVVAVHEFPSMLAMIQAAHDAEIAALTASSNVEAVVNGIWASQRPGIFPVQIPCDRV